MERDRTASVPAPNGPPGPSVGYDTTPERIYGLLSGGLPCVRPPCARVTACHDHKPRIGAPNERQAWCMAFVRAPHLSADTAHSGGLPCVRPPLRTRHGAAPGTRLATALRALYQAASVGGSRACLSPGTPSRAARPTTTRPPRSVGPGLTGRLWGRHAIRYTYGRRQDVISAIAVGLSA